MSLLGFRNDAFEAPSPHDGTGLTVHENEAENALVYRWLAERWGGLGVVNRGAHDVCRWRALVPWLPVIQRLTREIHCPVCRKCALERSPDGRGSAARRVKNDAGADRRDSHVPLFF